MIATYISKRFDPSHFTSPLARILLCAALFASASTFAAPNSNRIDLFPKLKSGQVIHYEITYRNEKQTKTQSSVVFAQAPADSVADVRALLRVEILEAALRGSRSVIRARTLLTPLDAGAAKVGPPSTQGTDAAPAGTPAPAVEFSIFPDGRIDQITGLDALSADQQQAWLQWAARFAGAAVFHREALSPRRNGNPSRLRNRPRLSRVSSGFANPLMFATRLAGLCASAIAAILSNPISLPMAAPS